MPGLFFYWTAWVGWVVFTFFMEKGKIRTEMTIVVLGIIACSSTTVMIRDISINLSMVILLFYGYRKLAELNRSRLLFTAGVCQVVALAYVGFFMYCLYDPAILWLDRKWMTAILIFLLVQFLVKPFSLRCLTAVIGVIHGNLLLAWIMHGYFLPMKAGSLVCFDLLAACLAMIAVWRAYEEFASLLNIFFKRTFSQKGHYSK
ncbi:MAG TPA: hypothetical protein VF199_10315 [Bacillales bacterium]